MTKEQTFFVFTICAAFLGAFFLLYPFLQYLVFALLLTYMLHPIKRRLQLRIRNRSIVALLMILLILVAVILPIVYVTTKLVREVRATVSMVTESPDRQVYLEKVERWIERLTGEPAICTATKSVHRSSQRFPGQATPNFGSFSEILLDSSSCYS
jgi:predicted PurR-regulated permease PerM